MSLKISNLATAKQVAVLQRLEYLGTGKYTIDRLTIQDATELITELFEEERLTKKTEQEKYGNLFDLLDPFNEINK